MVEEAKCLVVFTDLGVNLREANADLRPVERVLGFWLQLDRALAFGDGRIFLTQRRENLPKHGMASGVIGTFAK